MFLWEHVLYNGLNELSIVFIEKREYLCTCLVEEYGALMTEILILAQLLFEDCYES